MPVDVDKDTAGKAGAKAATSFLTGFGKGIDVNPGTGSFMLPLATLPAAIPIIGGLVSGIEALAGVLPIAGAGLVGLGIAGATMVVGFQGVIATLQEYWKAQDAALGKTAQLAAQQLSTKDSLISADEAVRHSRQAVTDAERNYADALIAARRAAADAVTAETSTEQAADRAVEAATRSLQQAEDSLTTAKHAALTAEQNLTDARLAANRALEDAPNKVKDAALAQKRAVQDMEDARQALFAPQDPSKPQDASRLGLAFQEASQRVDETGLALARAQEDADKLTKAGVNGSQQVVSAQDRVDKSHRSVQSAMQAVGDAQERLVQAQVDGDQRIIAAKQRVEDAQRNLTKTETSGDEQIQRAKEAVNDALRSQQLAIAQAGAAAESAAGSLSTYNDMLARLSPNAQGAVLAVVGLQGAWHSLQDDVQQHLFAGLGDEINTVAQAVMPIFQGGLDHMADGLNLIIRSTAEWLSSSDATRDMGIIFDNTGTAVANLAPGLKAVWQIIMDLVTVATGFLPGLAEGFSNSAQKVADFVREARDSGKLKEWMQQGLDVLRDLFWIGVDLVGIFRDFAGTRGPSTGFFDDLRVLIHDFRLLFDILAHVIDLLNAISSWHPPGWGIATWLPPGFGVFGHASGGVAGGLSLVGEHGPELVNLPQGSRVTPAGATRNALADGGGDNRVVLEWNLPGGASDFERVIFDLMRSGLQVRGGLAALA